MMRQNKIKQLFHNALSRFQHKAEGLDAVLGDADGNLYVSDDNVYLLYARLYDGTLLKVWNYKTLSAWNDPVVIGYEEGDPYHLRVLRSGNFFSTPNNPGIPMHNHEFGGPNPTWVWLQQFMPWAVRPSGELHDFVVTIYKTIAFNGLAYIAGGAHELDLESYIPDAPGARFALIQVQSNGTPGVVSGDVVENTSVLTIENIPIPDPGCSPIVAVRLYYGQSFIHFGDPATTDIADLRTTGILSSPSGGAGNVYGPSSALDNHLAKFDGTSGHRIKDGGAVADNISDAIHAAEEKTELEDGDEAAIWDSDEEDLKKVDLRTIHDPRYVRKWLKNAVPTVDDDITAGYERSDEWLDQTNGVTYFCIDDTEGVAVWVEVGTGAGDDIRFGVEGALAEAVNVGNAIIITKDMTVATWYIYLKETGASGSTIVDVNVNGSTIFGDPGDRPEIDFDDADGWAVSGAPAVTEFVAGDVITFDVDQIAPGAAGLAGAGNVIRAAIGSTAINIMVEDRSGTPSVDHVGQIIAPGVEDMGGGQVKIHGLIADMVMVQTREQDAYTAPITGDGEAITQLDLVITPKKAGNKIILEWVVNGESDHNVGFVVSRNGTLLSGATDDDNNNYAVIATADYDQNNDSTPFNAVVRIIDDDSLDVETTYQLLVRGTFTAPRTVYLNRSEGSAGGTGFETGLSTGTAIEVWS